MNKKLIVGILVFSIILIVGFIVISDLNKADTEVPNINSHLQKANTEYNNAVSYLNVKNYSEATTHINSSYAEYVQAKTSTENALSKAEKNNKSIQAEYFRHTLSEIDLKINATVEMYNGLVTVNNSPSIASKYFDSSNSFMRNATEYLNKRSLLEEQYPDSFIQ